ncbi:MAG: hypothetical protein O7H41_15170 [Planctomycetota bacterium]|nr:hypothetical protein [Planctomycetota bacterium]
MWRSIANGNGTDREAFEQEFLSRIESAYPDLRELSRKFRFRWGFFAITGPKNGTLTEETAIEATERDRVRSDIRRRVIASEEAEVRVVIASMAKDLRAQLQTAFSGVATEIQGLAEADVESMAESLKLGRRKLRI